MVPVDSDSLSRVESYSGALGAFSHFAYGTITPCGAGFRRLQRYYLRSQIRVLQPRPDKSDRFGLFRVRSPLLTKSRFLSLPGGNEMFQFPPFATYTYVFSIRSYRVSRGRYLFDGSHGLFAVFRALHRLLMPRHPPHALTSLTTLLNPPVIFARPFAILPFRVGSLRSEWHAAVLSRVSRFPDTHDRQVPGCNDHYFSSQASSYAFILLLGMTDSRHYSRNPVHFRVRTCNRKAGSIHTCLIQMQLYLHN